MASKQDNQFGPQLAGHFDFTLLFEQTIFEIVPSSVLVLATPFYLKSLVSHASKQVRVGALLWAKMIIVVILLAMYVAKAALWESRSGLRSHWAIATAVMSLLAPLCALLVLYSAHLYNKRLSAFVSVFFTVTMLLDIASTRSYFLRSHLGFEGLDTIGAIQIVVVVLKLLLIVLEEVPKTPLNDDGEFSRATMSDSRIGFWSKAIFFWVNSLLLFGFRNELTVENLPQIDTQFGSRTLFDQFTRHWRKLDKNGKFALLRACLRTIVWKFLFMVLPRLCYAGFSLSRPFLIQRVLQLINSGSAEQQTAHGLIGATILIYAGIAVSRSIYERLEYQVKVSIRGVLDVALYDKMQRLGMNESQSADAITLMSTDVMGVGEIISLLHETWATSLELAFGVYILYRFVGAACFLIFIPSIIATLSTYYSAQNMAKARGRWNGKISDRVQATSNVLKQLKDVKAMGLSSPLSDYIQQKRKEEVQVSLGERRSRVIMFATSAFNLSVTPVIVLAGARFWTKSTPQMTAAEIFSAYSVILIASEPLDTLLEKTIMWSSSYACITRIQDYLSRPDMDDPRQPMDPTETPDDCNEKVVSHLPKKANDVAFRMEDVSIRLGNTRCLLRNVNIDIQAGSFTMLHGSVGSGKSVFLQALLGELKPDEGKIFVASKLISFASQTPWLRNQTIRQNIVGLNDVIESLYEEVIYVCALDVDLAELPSGDETVIGTDGGNLSGGQKQRLGLARSLYIDAPSVILDDVLSALDSTTALTVFRRVFGPDGFLRRRGSTVIMSTNRVELLKAADVNLQIDESGTITERRSAEMPAMPETEAEADNIEFEVQENGAAEGELKKKNGDAVTSKTVPQEDKAGKTRRNGDISLYAYFFRSAGTFLFIFWILTTAIASVAEKMPKIFVKIWYSLAPDNDSYFAGFAMTAVANILCTAATAIFYFVKIVPNLSNELHWRLLRSTVGSTLSWISQTDSGVSLNRFSQDISIISQQLPIAFIQFVFILFNTLADIGIFAAGAKYAAPAILMLLVALYGIQYFYLRTSRQLRLLDLETSAPLMTLFKESFSGMQHVRASQWQEQFLEDCCRLIDRMQKPYYHLLSVQQWLTFVLDFCTCFIATILVGVSTTMPSSTSDTSIGLALINLVSFSMMTSALIRIWVILETCLGGLARIKTFCTTTPQETDGPSCSNVPENWPSTGKIEIDSISASYEYQDGSLHKALDNVSVVIEHGERAGIVGRTGSGKSSLFLALLHMVECSGTIQIDGRNISTVPREVLRSRITTLTQDGVEVEQSMRFNMFPFNEQKPSDESILETLDLVGLGDYVRSQGGIDVYMSKMKFSPGQKQLFFVARGILHHKTMGSKLVLMDEATSSMVSMNGYKS